MTELASASGPHQTAIGSSGACEASFFTARLLAESRPLDMVVLLDLKNAFNSLDRLTLVESVASRADFLGPYVNTFYRRLSEYWVRTEEGVIKLPGGSGVEQGDGLSPALFAVAIAPCFDRIFEELSLLASSKKVGPPFLQAFLDDCLLFLDPSLVPEALAICERVFQDLAGPTLARQKTQLWAFNPEAALLLPSELQPLFRSGGIKYLGSILTSMDLDSAISVG